MPRKVMAHHANLTGVAQWAVGPFPRPLGYLGELDMMPQTQWRMCHLQDRSSLLTLLFSPGDRMRRMVHRRHDDITLQNDAVNVL